MRPPISFHLILTALCLLAAGLSCGNFPSGVETPVQPGGVSTAVAATLAAVGANTQPAEPTPPAAPISTLAPTPAEPTQVPQSAPAMYLAYADAGGGLWMQVNQEAPRRLAQAENPGSLILSGDAARVAYTESTAEGRTSLWVVDTAGGAPRRLLSADDFLQMARDPAGYAPGSSLAEDVLGGSPAGLAWIPGTHTLVFSLYPQLVGPGSFLNDSLHAVDADSGMLVPLVPTGSGGVPYPSPDGQWLAVSAGTAIHLVRADGSAYQPGVLTFPQVMTYSEYEFIHALHWLPDSSAFLVGILPEDALGVPDARTAVWKVPVGGAAVRLSEVRTRLVTEPVFSPDGTKMAYLTPTREEISAEFDLHVANVDGSQDQVAAGQVVELLGWSPESLSLVYATGGYDAIQVLRVIPGSNPEPLADQPVITRLLWANEKEIVFASVAPGGETELRFGFPGGSSRVIVAPFPEAHSRFDVLWK